MGNTMKIELATQSWLFEQYKLLTITLRSFRPDSDKLFGTVGVKWTGGISGISNSVPFVFFIVFLYILTRMAIVRLETGDQI